jgi:TonB family protein
MKSPAGYEQPRRRAVPGKKQIRLDLQPAKRRPSPEEEIEQGQKSHFWKWFGIVALFHLVVIVGVILFYQLKGTPPRPEPFISLMPEGDTVKGTPGAQAAPKVGASTSASVVRHHPKASTPPVPAPVTPPPAATAPPPVAAVSKPSETMPKPDTLALAKSKPKPAKPAPPKPKVKVDLHLVDGPATASETPVAKPKHVKKTPPKVVLGDDSAIEQAEADPENRGLSREQIATKLGQKLDAAGVEHATKIGPSGASGGHPNAFADFYASIHDQVMNKWQEPNQEDPQATNPIVQIHVEQNGRVPPESATLIHSSGNQAIDDSALAAARSLGYTLEPLPDGCPPDISINFQLNHE